ncbi:uncharacterized protein LOC128198508 [Bicyclus anynana]|uniref:Uncharacterized protein LOC128198508 n=1 Tax=Bicyclus anynana TaxID=110368 RepID=A0ABM3LMK4_BICAN|nr:uncharacterized protein LOC128198508 [Bicyclus anynana]
MTAYKGFALLLIQAITIQGLIQRIEHNPGILPVKEGQAYITYDNWTYIKILDLGLLKEDLDYNVRMYEHLNINLLKYFGNETHFSDISNVKTQTDHFLNITVEKCRQLIPISRTKRGILNPLGSLIKIITGNLDNSDAMRYDELITTFKTRQERLSRKMTIVSEMVESFVNMTGISKNNLIQLDKEISDIKLWIDNTKRVLSSTRLIHTFHLFLHNFQTIYIKIDEIETAIAFSKLKTLHQSVINTDELYNLLSDIAKTDQLVYPVNLENLLKIEQSIELKAYSKNNQVTFILDIPLVKKYLFNYFRMIPLPVTNPFNQTSLIIPKAPYLLVKGSKTVPLSKPCKEIEKFAFLCHDIDTESVIKDTCLEELMLLSQNTSSCDPVLVETSGVKVESIQYNQWIIYSKFETLLLKICSTEETRERIKGTYILTIDENCSFKINGLTLKRHETVGRPVNYSRIPTMHFPTILKADELPKRKLMNLDGVNLQHLQQLAYRLEQSDSEVFAQSETSYSGINVKSISVGTLLLYVILAICLCIMLLYKFPPLRLFRQIPHSAEFELKEGGVMSGQQAGLAPAHAVGLAPVSFTHGCRIAESA